MARNPDDRYWRERHRPGVHNFEATIPEGAGGICFTASSTGPQTTDILDLSAEGWYTSGAQDGEGKFIALPWGGGSGGKVVKFTNNQNWGSVFVHYWTSGGTSSEWPGIQMNDIGENGIDAGVHNFEASVPDDTVGLVFTAGTNGPQTTDITDLSAEGWYTNGTKDGDKFVALPWGGSSVGETYTVRFSCSWGGTVKAYYWADGNTPFDWNSAPAMNVEQQDNGYGQTVYIIDIPKTYNMVIFQNGSTQTVDINTNSQSTNYYDAGESGGKHNVETW